MSGVLFPVAPRLTPRQQLVHEACALQPLTALAAGIILHAASDCRHCTEDQPCQYADRNGREVLEALRRKDLVKRDRHHVYRRTDGATSEPGTAGYDPATVAFPEGF